MSGEDKKDERPPEGDEPKAEQDAAEDKPEEARLGRDSGEPEADTDEGADRDAGQGEDAAREAAEDAAEPEAGKSEPESILEGEFTEANQASEEVEPPAKDSEPGQQAGRRRGGRLGWIFFFLLAAFVGGVFAAPYAESQLRAFGLMAPESPQTAAPAPQVDLSPVRDRLDSIAGTLSRVQERLGSVDSTVSRLSEESAGQASELSTLNRRVRAVESGGADGEGATGGEMAADAMQAAEQAQRRVAELRERMTALEEAQEQAAAEGEGEGEGEGDTDAQAFTQAVATLTSRLEAVSERIASLEQQVAERPEAADAETLRSVQESVAALRPRLAGIDRLRERVAGLESAFAERPEPVRPSEIENLTQALTAAANERQRLMNRLDALGRRLATLEAIERNLSGVGASLSGEIARLSRRVDSGQAFAADLAAVDAAVAELPEVSKASAASALAALRPYASDGVPTRQALASRFDEAATRILRRGGADPDAGWLKRLGRQLSSVVVVRKAGVQQGDDPEAVLSRAEAELAAGDLAGAITELEDLPPETRAPSDAWIADARARLEADRAVGELLSLLTTAGRGAGDADQGS